MITAEETKKNFKANPTLWKTSLMDFVDDFRNGKDPQAVAVPFGIDDERKDAVLASAIETVCDELKLKIPSWLCDVPACRDPYFVAEVEDLKATAIVESPVRFRLRKVFVQANFLHRV